MLVKQNKIYSRSDLEIYNILKVDMISHNVINRVDDLSVGIVSSNIYDDTSIVVTDKGTNIILVEIVIPSPSIKFLNLTLDKLAPILKDKFDYKTCTVRILEGNLGNIERVRFPDGSNLEIFPEINDSMGLTMDDFVDGVVDFFTSVSSVRNNIYTELSNNRNGVLQAYALASYVT